MADRVYVKPERIMFREFCETMWLPHVEETRRPSTVESYRRQLLRHVYPVLGHMPLQKIGPTDVDRLYRLCGQKQGRGDAKLTPATVRVIGAIASSALRYAKKKRLIVRNPAEDADLPAMTQSRHMVWTAAETRRFLDSVESERLYALWRILATTGCRRGEALGLEWRNINLDTAEIEIAQQLVPLSGDLVVSPPKTDSGHRILAIDQRTVEALREHQQTQQLEQAVMGWPTSDLDLVFRRQQDGRPLDPRGLSAAFQVRRKRAKLPHIRLHDLRHGVATLALAGNVNAELVRRQLGHSKVSTTIDTYQRHRLETAEREAAQVISTVIDNAPVSNP
jgi:integrase